MAPIYTEFESIDAATSSINSLAFSSDGRFLASASDDHLRIYRCGKRITTYLTVKGSSPFTALIWDDSTGTLLVGTFSGEVKMLSPNAVTV
jgi:WD40 repeat protein